MYEVFEQLLKEHGVTAYRVAKETGITTATFTSWKQGKYTPKQDKLQKIADYFGVTMDYLIGTKEEDKHSETPSSLKAWLRSDPELMPDEKDQLASDLEAYLQFRKNRIIEERNKGGK